MTVEREREGEESKCVVGCQLYGFLGPYDPLSMRLAFSGLGKVLAWQGSRCEVVAVYFYRSSADTSLRQKYSIA